MPANPKIKLIAGKAAEPSGHQQQKRVEQALGRRKTGKQDDRLAFEKGPDECDQIGIRAVFSNQLINVHSQPLPAPLLPWATIRGPEPADPPVAPMLSFSGTLVERDSCGLRDNPARRSLRPRHRGC